MFDKILTKKNTLIAELVAIIFLLLFYWFGSSSYCGNGNCDLFFEQFGGVMQYLYLGPLLLIFSLITYSLKTEVFKAWIGFTVLWIPLSVLVAILSPGSDGGYGWVANTFSARDKVLIASILLFIPISLIIITYKYFATRGK